MLDLALTHKALTLPQNHRRLEIHALTGKLAHTSLVSFPKLCHDMRNMHAQAAPSSSRRQCWEANQKQKRGHYKSWWGVQWFTAAWLTR